MGTEVNGSPEEIVLDGVPIPVLSLTYSDLSRFEQKLTIGDYSKDSDALLSTWAQSAWNGGVLIDEHLEGGTDQRSRWSTLWTRSAGQLALNPLAIAHQADSGDSPHYPVGDYNGDFWFAENVDLQTIDNPSTTHTLTSVPVALGVEYAGELIIPLGSAGIDIFDGSAITNDSNIEAISLLLWDDKVFALCVDGEVLVYDGSTWSSPSAPMTIPGAEIPRKLVAFFDRSGNLTVSVITSRGIWFWDSDANVLHKSRLAVPPHPDNGLGACEWRDDGLFYSAGLGVYRHSASGVVSAMGLDRDDGLPADYRGRIRDLVPEHNGVIALLEGTSTLTPAIYTDPGEYDVAPFPEDMAAEPQSSPAKCAVMIWNEAGWHVLHALRSLTEVTWMYLSTSEIEDIDHDYTLIVGLADQLLMIPLPTVFLGPRQLVQSQVLHFEPDGTHETGRFDSGMAGFEKLASHFEVMVRDPRDNQPFEGSIRIDYRTNFNNDYTLLGTVTRYGRTVFPFNLVDGFARGTIFGWIEFRYTITRGANTKRTPIIDHTVLKFIKLPLEGRSWTATVNLEWETYKGLGPAQLAQHITDLALSNTFSEMKHLGETYRVRVSQVNGAEATGHDQRKALTLSIVECPIPGWSPP